MNDGTVGLERQLFLEQEISHGLLRRAKKAEQKLKDLPAKFRDEYTHYGIGMCVKPMQAQHENIGIDRCIEIVEQAILTGQ